MSFKITFGFMEVFIILLVQNITLGGLTIATNKTSLLSLSTIVQNTLTNSVLNTTVPIDVAKISTQMANGFKKVKSTSTKLLLLTALPTLNSENLLSLVSSVHQVFDNIIATTRGLEHKLNGIIGVIDLPIINIQVALQTLIQAIVVNVVIVSKTTDTTQNIINYSLFGIIDGIKFLSDTVHNLLHGIVTLPRNDLAKSITCLEGIVQTILSITENVLQTLSEFLSNFEMNSTGNTVMSEFIMALTKSLDKLANQLADPVTVVVKESLEPTLVHIISKLKANMTSVNESTLNLVKNIIHPINGLVATITDSEKSEAKRSLLTIPYITRTISSSILSVCDGIQTLNVIPDGVKSTFYVALSNVVASLHSLTAYLTVITGYRFASSVQHNTKKLLTDTQIVLLLLVTNFQNLIDTATQVISQSLIYTLRSRREEIQNALKDVQESSMKIVLLVENIIKVNLHAIQTLLNVVSQVIHNILGDYSKFLAALAMSIAHTIGNFSNVIGEVLPESIAVITTDCVHGQLSDVARNFKIIVNNVENLSIYVRNTLKEIELVL